MATNERTLKTTICGLTYCVTQEGGDYRVTCDKWRFGPPSLWVWQLGDEWLETEIEDRANAFFAETVELREDRENDGNDDGGEAISDESLAATISRLERKTGLSFRRADETATGLAADFEANGVLVLRLGLRFDLDLGEWRVGSLQWMVELTDLA